MRSLLNFLLRYKTLILFLLLEGVALIMLTSSHNYHQSLTTDFARGITGRISGMLVKGKSYLTLREVNEKLIAENLSLRQKLENLSLKPDGTFMNVEDTIYGQKYRYLSARVVNNSVNKQKNFLTLNKGHRQGVAEGMAVISPDGVVGIVVGASQNYSVAMSLLNNDFRLSARIQKNDYFGSLAWEGKNYRYAMLSEIPHHVLINPGDTIVTSGFSAIFPEGLMIGTLTGEQKKRGDFVTLEVQLAADFKRLTDVYVIGNLEKNERAKLEEEVVNE